MPESTPPLAKYLASTEKKTRDKAVKNLTNFLSEESQDGISKQEMDKLWKGIFYCFWMSDKPLVQQALAKELADILLSIKSTTVALQFLQGFWQTTVREWSGIDRLRIDKYYLLIRRFVNASFKLLIQSSWELRHCEAYNDILTCHGGPLCANDTRVPVGLAFHLLDIYVEELDKAAAECESLLPTPLIILLQPFVLLAARAPSSVTYKRIESALLTPVLQALSPCDEPLELEPSDETEHRAKRMRLTKEKDPYPHLTANMCIGIPSPQCRMSKGAVKAKLLRILFDAASKEDSRDSNRRKIYALCRNNSDDDEDDGAV